MGDLKSSELLELCWFVSNSSPKLGAQGPVDRVELTKRVANNGPEGWRSVFVPAAARELDVPTCFLSIPFF